MEPVWPHHDGTLYPHLCLHSLALVPRTCCLLLLAETSWWRATTVVRELPAGQEVDQQWVGDCFQFFHR